jgi:allophanate hydrolase subunit 1
METPASGGAQFRIASDQALIVYFDSPATKITAKAPPLQINAESHEQVRRLLRLIELEPIPGLRNLHPAYSSLLIKFDALKLRHSELEEILRGYIERMKKV